MGEMVVEMAVEMAVARPRSRPGRERSLLAHDLKCAIMKQGRSFGVCHVWMDSELLYHLHDSISTPN